MMWQSPLQAAVTVIEATGGGFGATGAGFAAGFGAAETGRVVAATASAATVVSIIFLNIVSFFLPGVKLPLGVAS